MILRPYQERAVQTVHERWAGGSRAVCLVAPTGSGKTAMAEAICHGKQVLFLAHRNELVSDDEAMAESDARTIQGLSRSGERPPAEMIVCDEAHSVGYTPEWRKVLADYPDAKILGLTATPERGDGSPLGDIYDSLVTAATYSDLIADGYLVSCRLYRPKEQIEQGLAQPVVKAWSDYAPEGAQGFVYCRSVSDAMDLADSLTAAGVSAACISSKQSKDVRKESMWRFRTGGLRVLTNCYCLVEGVNVPNASVCVLARGCGHPGSYIQMAGRVLRPHSGKEYATIIDLSGAAWKHGYPTLDRIYSLHGRAITPAKRSLRVCLECGLTYEAELKCPGCGHVEPVRKPKPQRIYSIELEAVYDGANTPETAMEAEWNRLADLAKDRSWSLFWALKQFRDLFPGCKPAIRNEDSRYERVRLERERRAKGYKRGYVWARLKALEGK